MIDNNNASLNSWDDFKSNWLKAEIVKATPAIIVVIKARSDINPQGDPQVVLTVNYNTKKFDFSINKTNLKFLEDHGVPSPKAAIGKKLTLVKDKVYNPKLKQRVDSLFIDKVE